MLWIVAVAVAIGALIAAVSHAGSTMEQADAAKTQGDGPVARATVTVTSSS